MIFLVNCSDFLFLFLKYIHSEKNLVFCIKTNPHKQVNLFITADPYTQVNLLGYESVYQHVLVNWLACAGNWLNSYTIYRRVRVCFDAGQYLAYSGHMTSFFFWVYHDNPLNKNCCNFTSFDVFLHKKVNAEENSDIGINYYIYQYKHLRWTFIQTSFEKHYLFDESILVLKLSSDKIERNYLIFIGWQILNLWKTYMYNLDFKALNEKYGKIVNFVWLNIIAFYEILTMLM